ncbi:MutS protein msh5 [Podila humilis]|nr:MutS protein msh5 [Podila humilis]
MDTASEVPSQPNTLQSRAVGSYCESQFETQSVSNLNATYTDTGRTFGGRASISGTSMRGGGHGESMQKLFRSSGDGGGAGGGGGLSTETTDGHKSIMDNLDVPVGMQGGGDIILAINFRGRKMGCAYFDTQFSKLFVMQDMTQCKSLDVVETNLGHVMKFEVRPSGEFSPPLGKSRLMSVMMNIRLASRTVRAHDALPQPVAMADEATQKEALVLLSNVIDIQSTESMDTITARHQAVASFLRPENSVSVDQMAACLGHIKNIPKILLSLHRRVNISEWRAIHQIQERFSAQDLIDVATTINNIVDFDESVNEGRCVVKHNVDEQLDEMRRTYQGLDSFLSEIAKKISETIPSEFTHTINVIYFPQLGYLIAIPMNTNWEKPEDFELEGLSFQFKTEQTVYYKNDEMRQLDEHLGDLHGLIVDREIDILQALQERIQEYEVLLRSCSEICSELDAHPLQELSVNSFVPNNTTLGEVAEGPDDGPASIAPSRMTDPESKMAVASSDTSEGGGNRIMILCGANCSGKSVFLKQVALITYMAHIGSFVPAESAVIGITDKILTRLQTCESVSSNQSVFMTDLQQVSLAIRMSTNRSLIILDEFGKGTASADGAGLFCGTIEHFAALAAADRPKVVASTHFHELFENQLLDMSLPISLYMMEIYQEADEEDATFLFRVVPGNNPCSLGPACAASSGVPIHVVKRGAYLSRLFRRFETVIPIMNEYELELMAMYETLARMLTSIELKDIEAQLRLFKRKVAEYPDSDLSVRVAAGPSRVSTADRGDVDDEDDDEVWTEEHITAFCATEEDSQDSKMLMEFDPLENDCLQMATKVAKDLSFSVKKAVRDEENEEEAKKKKSEENAREAETAIDEMLAFAAQLNKLEQEYATMQHGASDSESESESENEYEFA